MKTHVLSLTVNGEARTLTPLPTATLLDVLRDELRLTGVKKGCDQGACGACTVLADGRRIKACLALSHSYDGRAITTIEGLGTDGLLHPVGTCLRSDERIDLRANPRTPLVSTCFSGDWGDG